MASGLEADKYLANLLELLITSKVQMFSVVELTTGTSDALDLHPNIHELGAGVIEEYVHIQRDKGFGFIRYNSHAEVAQAIHFGNVVNLTTLLASKLWMSLPTQASNFA
ncbi:hypothetical protein RDI58_029132 [Solanum bulbocastanum]|uniref:RRM domain-containing protein n=1 Tax=Solanum bulbocastanum TaxID=147425 RepID=A0AAN8Y1U0_SOLBU